MAEVMYFNFNSDDIGNQPTMWNVSPTMSCLVAQNPYPDEFAYQLDKVVHINGDAADGEKVTTYGFDSVESGKVSFQFHVLRDNITTTDVFRIAMYDNEILAAGFQLERLSDKPCLTLLQDHTALCDESGPVSYETETWYRFEVILDLDSKTFTVLMNGIPLGLGSDGAFVKNIPFYLESGQTEPADKVNKISFSLNGNSSNNTNAYFNEVKGTSYNQQDAPPENFTFMTGFELDQAQVTAYQEDIQVTDLAHASNVFNDTLSVGWISNGACKGANRLLFDLGADGQCVLRFFIALSVNLEYSNLESIKFYGGNERLVWKETNRSVDFLLDYEDWFQACEVWIPEHLPCRYYALEFNMREDSNDPISIGRTFGTSSYFSTEKNPNNIAKINLKDPSVVTEMEDGLRQFRRKHIGVQLALHWNAMSEDDVKGLSKTFGRGGRAMPWLVSTSPKEGAEEGMFCYLEDQDFEINELGGGYCSASLKLRNIEN